ncbi:MAG TPA: hypothetical protein VFI43_08895 [Nitrosospira sp.]|nr:hypothetical protein [Nitrosospira sp.]
MRTTKRRGRTIKADISGQRDLFSVCSLLLKVIVALAILVVNTIAAASADTFRNSCEKTVGAGKVVVTYIDSETIYNSSHSTKSLQSRTAKSSDSYHSIYGLTHAEPSFRLEIRSRLLVNADGQTCMVPDVSVKLGFSAMHVYLAKELGDSCRKNIVREHELEHVSTWKSHFRIGAKMLKEPLRAAFSRPRHYSSEKEAQADLKPWVEEVLKPLQHKLVNSVMDAQRAIDAPASYERVRQRLYMCLAGNS